MTSFPLAKILMMSTAVVIIKDSRRQATMAQQWLFMEERPCTRRATELKVQIRRAGSHGKRARDVKLTLNTCSESLPPYSVP